MTIPYCEGDSASQPTREERLDVFFSLLMCMPVHICRYAAGQSAYSGYIQQAQSCFGRLAL
jgi:hypothetical protein